MESDLTIIVSLGGGVNSTAVLVGMMERKERPDHIVFADTGGERPETYDHVKLLDKWCDDVGFPAVATVMEGDGLENDCIARDTLPGKAFGFGSCSERFKIRPQRRYIKQQGVTNPIWLVGIHAGESHRAERTLNQRSDVRFPLIEWGWGQAECVAAIQRAGLPVPVKSACFFCPSMKKKEVLELAEKSPELYQRAVEMEDAALDNGLTTVKGLGRSYSWRKLVEADKAQLRLPIFDDMQHPVCDTCVDW